MSTVRKNYLILLPIFFVFLSLPGCATYYKIKMNEIDSGEYFRDNGIYIISKDDYIKAYQPMANDGYAPAIEKINEIKADEEARKKEEAEKEQRNEQQLEDAKKQLALEQAAKVALDEEKEQALVRDQRRGYKHMSLQDFILDAKRMPLSKKVALEGYYILAGKIERISEYPTSEEFGNRVLIITNTAERKSRKALLSDYACQQAYCPVIILGKVSRCELSLFGRKTTSDACVIVDEVRLQ